MKVWCRGKISGPDGACIPVLDHGFLYGDGVFEGIRVSRGRVFCLEKHLERLQASARAIGLEIPEPRSRVREIIFATLRAHGEDEAYIRLIVTRGTGPLGVDPTPCQDPSLVCIVGPIRLYSEEKRQAGIRLATSSLRRPPHDVLDPRVKSLNYLNNVLAKAEAVRAGADEALVLNQEGCVAEASVANVFAVLDGKAVSPPPSDGGLAGITRQQVLDGLRSSGFPTRESSLTRYDLFQSTEVFLTGSGAGLIGVASLDGTVIGNPGDRPVTRRVEALLDELRVSLGTSFDR